MALFYVSPTQINGVVDPATPAGAQTVIISSGGSSQTGSVTVSATAPPGLFALTGTGTRDGAILNAISFLLGAFTIQQSNTLTYLALFGTGIDTSTKPTVTIGGVAATVQFAGSAPCCDGLQQVNVAVPASVAGSGRVPVMLTSDGQASNTVQVVLLPPAASQTFSGDQPDQTRSRELANLAYAPSTSLVLSTDENDDVVRVIDVSTKKVSQVITLPQGAAPSGVAVNATGTVAVVSETGRGKAAILDLAKFTVITEVTTGGGSAAVAIAGTQAVVVNQDADSVSIIDLGSNTVQKTLNVGRGPVGVAADSASHKAYVTNEDDGTVSVIDLAGLSVAATWTLGNSVRPEAIALLPSAGVALVTSPAAGPEGQVLLVSLSTGKVTSTLSANPDRSGGSSDIAVFNSNVYFANQTGGSVSVLPISATGTAGTAATIKVGLGPRALAIDAKDKLLVVSNEGTGTLVLVDLNSGKVVGSINAVQTNMPGDDDQDDHSDRNGAANAPAISSVSPASSKAGASVNITVAGSNFTGATGLVFINPNALPGNGHGKGAPPDNNDATFTVANFKVVSATQITATVTIAPSAQPGPRVLRVLSPNGESTAAISTANTFTVMP
jgi:YVTN family beta-propeller protein